jgi:glycosidase
MELQQEKQAAALYLLSPGVPFLYYGEEIGMTARVTTRTTAADAVEHDGSNRRMRAAANATQAQRLAAGVDEQENDPDSLLSFYRQVLALRNQYPSS